MEGLPSVSRKAYQVCKANPGSAVACGAAGVGIAIVAAPVILAAPGLAAAGVAGFGAEGIVAGSTAAGFQQGIGSVVAPSLFATLQSAGAGGYGVATVYGAAQAVGGVVTSASLGTLAWLQRKK